MNSIHNTFRVRTGSSIRNRAAPRPGARQAPATYILIRGRVRWDVGLNLCWANLGTRCQIFSNLFWLLPHCCDDISPRDNVRKEACEQVGHQRHAGDGLE